MSLRRVLGLVLAGAMFALPACGALPTGKVPVDNPLNEFEPPDDDALSGDADEGWGDEWDNGESGGDSGGDSGGASASADPCGGDPCGDAAE